MLKFQVLDKLLNIFKENENGSSSCTSKFDAGFRAGNQKDLMIEK